MRESNHGIRNLFQDLPSSLPEELVTVLAQNPHVRIERIVSTGQASPAGCWYDQDEHEWVVLLMGEATVRFEDEDGLVALRCGDHLLIPAHARHRVEWTTQREPTVWLAVFYSD